MISLYYNTEDPFSLYGIEHFIDKSGISFELNKPSTSGIVITYGIEVKGKFVIKLEKNDIQDHICGRISLDNEKIPVCEIPHDTGSGRETVAYFKIADKIHPCATVNDGNIAIGIDIFKETGYLLSGHLDGIHDTSDDSLKSEIAGEPIVDALENLLYSSILRACESLQIPLVQKSFWPDSRSFALCLTHDVDELKKTYQYFTQSVFSLLMGDIQGFKVQLDSFSQKIKGNEPYWTYEDIFAIEKKFKVKSTYFILKESSKPILSSKDSWSVYGRNRSLKSPEMQTLFQKLKENGDEIGIHGSYLSYNNPQLLGEETRELEQLTGDTIIGIRQHYLRLDIPETWEYQVNTGLKYDSSLGFRHKIGFRWGTSFPFFPHTGKDCIPVLEIPLIIMDRNLGPFENKEQACITIAEKIKRYNGVLTLLWHSRFFNTREYPGFRDIYLEIIQYCQTKGAWIARAGDIYTWLSGRNQQTFSCCYQNSTITIIPSYSRSDFFLTIHLPKGTKGTIRSENADTILREGDIMYIKTHDLDKSNDIVIEITW
jgi:peptidoglycan/xylan/chitin deacetylase (PgdA/CDA1 family)